MSENCKTYKLTQ